MYFLGYLNLIKTIKRLKVRINVRRKRFKTSGKNIVIKSNKPTTPKTLDRELKIISPATPPEEPWGKRSPEK